jgi:hypothetical protein
MKVILHPPLSMMRSVACIFVRRRLTPPPPPLIHTRRCLAPILIRMLVRRFNGADVYINGYANWCPQYYQYQNEDYLFLTLNEANGGIEFTRSRVASITFGLAFVFIVLDVSWIVMLWATAMVGTPTNGIGRDDHQRRLLMFKMLVLNAFPLVLLITGILFVEGMRYDNYGCGIGVELVTNVSNPEYNFAATLFKVLLVTYALELLVFPSIIVNRIVSAIRNNRAIRTRRYETKAKGERLEYCLGLLLRCISVCCSGQGGKEIKNRGEMRDFASNLVRVTRDMPPPPLRKGRTHRHAPTPTPTPTTPHFFSLFDSLVSPPSNVDDDVRWNSRTTMRRST